MQTICWEERLNGSIFNKGVFSLKNVCKVKQATCVLKKLLFNLLRSRHNENTLNIIFLLKTFQICFYYLPVIKTRWVNVSDSSIQVARWREEQYHMSEQVKWDAKYSQVSKTHLWSSCIVCIRIKLGYSMYQYVFFLSQHKKENRKQPEYIK